MNEVNITSGLLIFNAADYAFARYKQRLAFLERPVFQSLLPQ